MITMERPVEPKPPVVIGEVLPNGAIVLAHKWRPHTKGEAEGIHGFVLCLLAGNFHPFIVWNFVKNPDAKEITLLNGDYLQDIQTAVISFRIRSKNIY